MQIRKALDVVHTLAKHFSYIVVIVVVVIVIAEGSKTRVVTYKVLRSAFHPPSNLMKSCHTGVKTRIETAGTHFWDLSHAWGVPPAQKKSKSMGGVGLNF